VSAFRRRWRQVAAGLGLALLLQTPVEAVEPVAITADTVAIDLTNAVEFQRGTGDLIQVSTAPGADGIVRRIEVRAREPGSNPTWLVFALSNETGEQIDRLLVAPHYRFVGSGLFRPDLGNTRIVSITPSQGFRPEREESTDSDAFLITLDPGTTITFVAELREPRVPQLTLWDPDTYKDRINSFTLFQGIVIGIAGLSALFLTVLFLVKGGAMFPAAAGFAIAALLYITIDFGFLQRIIPVTPAFDRINRAVAEASLAGTLLVFLFAYLNLSRWHLRFLWIALVWMAGLATLVVAAFFDPSLAAGVARLSAALTAGLGFLLILYLAAMRGYDRAVMLVPTWVLLILWLVAGALGVTGALSNDLMPSAISAGLVLIALLIGFTVAQHAFAGGQTQTGAVSDVERRALALVGAGDVIWDWDVTRDRIYTSPEAEQALGLKRGTLICPPIRWLEVLHPNDRDRFRVVLEGVTRARRGRINEAVRLRAADGHYRWYQLRARPVVGSDGEVIRCIGTLADVTETKTAEERLLHDAINDNLTGLPNRELFLDRLSGALIRARQDDTVRPAVFVIDIDKFKQVNDSVGLSVGDSILMTLARRLARLLKPQDTIGRVSGDRFAILLLSEHEPERIAAFADQLRRTLRQPITFGERDIFLTASIGLVVFDGKYRDAVDMMQDSELALATAKRMGADRIEAFKPSMRSIGTDRLALEADLKRAMEREEIKVVYQPIIRLEDSSIAGFEAQLRWEHPRRGRIKAEDFRTLAEDIDLINDLTLFQLDRAAQQLSIWQRSFPVDVPLSVSVDIASTAVLRQDLIADVRGVLMRHALKPGTLHLEVSEAIVAGNPEYATKLLEKVADTGCSLVLDNFGQGQSSLTSLGRLPLDGIKIGRALLKAKGGRSPVLRSLVMLGRDLSLAVTAEGTDSVADVSDIQTLGFTHGQGSVFGEPMTADEATQQLSGAARLAAAQ
jgi:diguanylate cyclase (GGDEF)-like protein/PAS domain S-box-containing protein